MYNNYTCYLSNGRMIFCHSSEPLEENELNAYVDHVEHYAAQYAFVHKLQGFTLNFDGEYVGIEYDTGKPPHFCRLRRITGYLVGDVDRWNDGKRAELHDRKKHVEAPNIPNEISDTAPEEE